MRGLDPGALVAAQQESFRICAAYSGADQVRRTEETLAAPAAAEVERLRRALYDRGGAGDPGIAPQVWFAAVTRKIDDLKRLEDRLSSDLAALVARLQREAWRAMVAALAVAAVAGLAAAASSASLAQMTTTVGLVGDLVSWSPR